MNKFNQLKIEYILYKSMEAKEQSSFKFIPMISLCIVKTIDSYIHADMIATHLDLEYHFKKTLNED